MFLLRNSYHAIMQTLNYRKSISISIRICLFLSGTCGCGIHVKFTVPFDALFNPSVIFLYRIKETKQFLGKISL